MRWILGNNVQPRGFLVPRATAVGRPIIIAIPPACPPFLLGGKDPPYALERTQQPDEF